MLHEKWPAQQGVLVEKPLKSVLIKDLMIVLWESQTAHVSEDGGTACLIVIAWSWFLILGFCQAGLEDVNL